MHGGFAWAAPGADHSYSEAFARMRSSARDHRDHSVMMGSTGVQVEDHSPALHGLAIPRFSGLRPAHASASGRPRSRILPQRNSGT
jgi:hypothetical protein